MSLPDPELAKKWPLGAFELIDLTVQSDEEIYQHGCAAGMEYFLKHQRSKTSPVLWVEDLLKTQKLDPIQEKTGFQYIRELLKYNLYACGDKNDAQELEKLFSVWEKYIPS